MRRFHHLVALCLASVFAISAYAQEDTLKGSVQTERVPLHGVTRKESLRIGAQISGSYLNNFRRDGRDEFADDVAADWSDCTDGGGAVDITTVHCFDEALIKYEAILNSVYGQAMSSLGPAAKNSLRSSQRKWVEFRSLEDRARQDYSSDGQHGSIMTYVVYFQSIYTVRERIMELMMYNGANEG